MTVFGDAPLMVVTLLVPLSDHDGSHEPGDVVHVPDDLAEIYHNTGIGKID